MNQLITSHSPRTFVRIIGKINWPVAVVALLTWLSIVVCLDPAGSYPTMPEGPGLTVDEIFNAEQGVYLMESARMLGWLNLVPGTSQEAFRPGNGFYNPDHPPLGRCWLGLHHHLTWWLFPPTNPDGPTVTACARSGSATAFALTVLLVGCFATAWFGQLAGFLAAVSVVLMPRVYGHAHLASLETITNLTCTLAVLVVAHWWTGPAAPRWRTAAFTGAIFGLALLTKIQAVFIPIPVIVWALWHWKTEAISPLVIWSLTALVVFFAGWPYLWFAPVEHGLQFLGRATHRATIHVWYFGQRYSDTQAPWHYPFVIFGLTVPVVLHAFGLLGLLRLRSVPSPRLCGERVRVRGFFLRMTSGFAQGHLVSTPNASSSGTSMKPEGGDHRNEPGDGAKAFQRVLLLLICTVFPLIVFAVPGVAVYDGERLFLTCFPLWAIFVGRGAADCWTFLRNKTHSISAASVVLAILLAITASPLITTSPCHLCYYNEAILLLGGVDRLGLEVDYWGEGITRQLLHQVIQVVPEGEAVAVIPTLHQFQAEDYYRQSPILRSHGNRTVEYHENSPSQKYVLVYRRLADLPKAFANPKEIPGWKFVDGSSRAFLARRD